MSYLHGEVVLQKANWQAQAGEVLLEELDLFCLYTLSGISGVGIATLWKLLRAAGSPQAVWNASREFLAQHLSKPVQEAFLRRQDMGLETVWLEKHCNKGLQVISYQHPTYPPLLREIYHPPVLLYVQGNIQALHGKTLALVGTRSASEYGRRVTSRMIEDLKPEHISIVSGLAAGIDTEAHWAAIKNQLPTVAVFGCGLDIVFPMENRLLSQEIIAHHGALVSEYPLGTPPSRSTFPQRNRIVAGLSHGVVVIEGDVKSGALITAKLGMEEGRTIFAVPGNIFATGSQGPMQLLKNGAVPVSNGEDILNELQTAFQQIPSLIFPDLSSECRKSSSEKPVKLANFQSAHLPEVSQFGVEVPSEKSNGFDRTAFSQLSEEESQLFRYISCDPVAIEDLAQTAGLGSAKINELLTLLELEGLIVLLPGAKVCRKSIF